MLAGIAVAIFALACVIRASEQTFITLTSSDTGKPGLYSVYLSGGSADLGKSIGGLSMACGSTNLHYVCQDAAGGGNIVNGAGEDIVAPGGSYVACVPWVPPIFC